MLAFAGINEPSDRTTSGTAWVVCRAMMNGCFDHHGMEFSCGRNIHGTDVCFDDALDLVVGGMQTIYTIGIHSRAGEDAAGVRIDDEQWVLSGIQQDGICTLASNLWERQECPTQVSTFTGHQSSTPAGCRADVLGDVDKCRRLASIKRTWFTEDGKVIRVCGR